MEYDPSRNNLHLVITDGEKARAICHRKAQAGALYWRVNSVIRTGYNASHVQVVSTHGPEGQIQEIVYAYGHYAKWRELGSRYAGASAPERVLLRSQAIIRDS